MIYSLLHWLFGWDFIFWENSSDQGVARVKIACDGKVYYWRYRITRVLDVIKTPHQVVWLTCKPEKYFSKEAA